MQGNFILKFADRMHVDWYIFVPAFLISLAGLITMNSFYGENYFFYRQSIWILVSICLFFVTTTIDWRFLRRTNVLVPIFTGIVAILIILLVIANTKNVEKETVVAGNPARFLKNIRYRASCHHYNEGRSCSL